MTILRNIFPPPFLKTDRFITEAVSAPTSQTSAFNAPRVFTYCTPLPQGYTRRRCAVLHRLLPGRAPD